MKTKPFHLRMFDEVYDVWIADVRDTDYSLGHETLSPMEEAYWNLTWAELGIYDNVAITKTMKEITGAYKVLYVGQCRGSIMMQYGIAHRESDFMLIMSKNQSP